MYTKYTRAKAVRTISNAKMVGLFSTALKYPCCSMSAKTSVWRNMAPPKQLKPSVWNSVCMRRSCLAFVAFIIIANSKSKDADLCVMNQRA
jgi:hypothetical protein